MIEGLPKISVLIICYKQEELIKRAINSLLAQKDYIYEICVSDDCSPDRTWEVLQEYDKQYPGLFKLHQNRPNIGIFENIEQTWTMPTGDIVYELSGDDACGENWFKTVVDFIKDNKIDYKNELFCIYGDVKTVFPNGDALITSNRAVLEYHNSFSLAIRSKISGRTACYSINILRKFFKCSEGRSYAAENAIDREKQLFTEKAYYIKAIGNIYFAGVGVSANDMKKKTSTAPQDYKNLNSHLIKHYKSHGVVFDQKDLSYFKYSELKKQLRLHFSIGRYFEYLLYKHKQYIPGTGTHISYYFKRLFFAIGRRLPHKKPIIISLS